MGWTLKKRLNNVLAVEKAGIRAVLAVSGSPVIGATQFLQCFGQIKENGLQQMKIKI